MNVEAEIKMRTHISTIYIFKTRGRLCRVECTGNSLKHILVIHMYSVLPYREQNTV